MKKRYIVEIGMGIDLHGENQTEAACRAVRDAVSRSCLCGLMEILELQDPSQMEVDALVAVPEPDEVDLAAVEAAIPVGCRKARAERGGLTAQGLCVPQFADRCDRIIVANAALTVYVEVP